MKTDWRDVLSSGTGAADGSVGSMTDCRDYSGPEVRKYYLSSWCQSQQVPAGPLCLRLLGV